MPRGLTDYVNDAIMARLCLGSSVPITSGALPLTTAYLGISCTAPDRAGNNWTEPSGGGYARQPIVCGPTANTQWKQKSKGIYQSTVPLQFPLPTATWAATPELSVGLWDSLTNGNMVSFATHLRFPILITQYGPTVYIPAGWLEVGIHPWWNRRGGISQYWADKLAAWLFTGASISWPSLWAALCTVQPVPTDTGITITEPSGPLNSGDAAGACYSRQTMASWHQLSPGRYGNTGTVFWPYPTPVPP